MAEKIQEQPQPAQLDRLDVQITETGKMLAARKVVLANRMRAGEDVSAAELDQLTKAEIRHATMSQFVRLRELTRDPGASTG